MELTSPTPPLSLPGPPTRAWPVFWVTLFVGLVCVLAKMTHIDPPDEWTARSREVYLRTILVITAADALYATTLGLVAWPLVHVTRRWRRVQAVLWACFVAIALTSVVFAVV